MEMHPSQLNDEGKGGAYAFLLPAGRDVDVEVGAMVELEQPSQSTKQKPSVQDGS